MLKYSIVAWTPLALYLLVCLYPPLKRAFLNSRLGKWLRVRRLEGALGIKIDIVKD